MSRNLIAIVIVIGLGLSCGCIVQRQQLKSSALDFLYPPGEVVAPATDVELTLPVRVGLAFAPVAAQRWADTFDETRKRALLQHMADAFQDRSGIESVQVVPSSFLEIGGGFENLKQIGSALGIDVIALVSYDQFQFSESGRSSLAYWTILGAYVVKGEKNETRTMMDAVVYDIHSRAMLFSASGQSVLAGRSTPVRLGKVLRDSSAEGFDQATTDLLAGLEVGLAAFEKQAATGSVRGRGTPAITMVDASGQPVTPGEGGAGSGGAVTLLAVLLLGASAWSGLARKTPRHE